MTMLSKLRQLLEQAKDAGASDNDLAEIRQQFLMMTDFRPTKKVLTRKQRRTKRLMQRASRKTNWGTFKGRKCHKGQKFKLNN